MTAKQDALHALFHPRAVAVIGASDDDTKHGYIKYIIRWFTKESM